MSSLTLREAVPLAHALVGRVAADAGVRVLFIKGPAAVAQGLRTPRASADTDVLVDPSGLELLRERLTALGWVDEHPYSTPTAADYSRTHRHVAWPCELDLHVTFPGLYADPQGVFEQLWARHDTIALVGQEVTCPDLQAHALVLALNCLRDPHRAGSAAQLADLVDRVSSSFAPPELDALGVLAGDLGAADTAAPFLASVGAPNPGVGSTAAEDLRAWRLRTQPAWRVATWLDGLRAQPLRSLPRYLWRAAFLDEAEIRIADPNLAPGGRALARARWRRVRRGVKLLPSALRFVSGPHRGPGTPPAGSTAPVSLPVPGRLSRLSSGAPRRLAGDVASTALGAADIAIARKRGAVIRTFPDFDDQGVEMAAALAADGYAPLTWLVKSGPPDSGIMERLPHTLRIVRADSLPGMLAYARARVVIHTHGLYGSPIRSRAKLFVNLWHGWGTKQLVGRSRVARRQSDLVTVSSERQAADVSEAWELPRSRVIVTGLPRNDAMMRARSEPRSPGLALVVPDGQPLVVWLPTYRNSVIGEIRADGHDFGNDFQLPGTTAADVAARAAQLAIHLVVKPHPMARVHEAGEHGHLSIWDDSVLSRLGTSLYQLLGQSDALITDYSSVWVDYLLVDRPLVFTTADAAEYARTRGAIAPEELESRLPGPAVTDLDSLANALRAALATDPWSAQRRALRASHHSYVDARSASRVSSIVRAAVRRP